MSETLLLAEPATEVSGTRPWSTVVWRERFSSLGARWGIAPAPELQGDPRLPLHALSSSNSDESGASASCFHCHDQLHTDRVQRDHQIAHGVRSRRH